MGKPVIILRDESERMEAVWEGLAVLAGTKKDTIVEHMRQCIASTSVRHQSTVFGDGHAGERIARILKQHLEVSLPVMEKQGQQEMH
jgi:UDP-N-acetylglucosamine 2-epimerase (non-hydrolysing)